MIFEITISYNLIKPIGVYIVSFLGRFVKKFLGIDRGEDQEGITKWKLKIIIPGFRDHAVQLNR